MRGGFLVGLIALAACSGRGPQQVGAEPSWRRGGERTASAAVVASAVTFAPASEPARRYNEPVQAPAPTPLGDAVTAAVREVAKQSRAQVPVADARLFRACQELAEVVPEDSVVGYSLVEFAMQRQGIIEPSPRLLVVWADLDSVDAIVDQLRPRIAELLQDGATARLGVGAARRSADGREGAVVFALQGSGVTTQPIPRAVAAGGSFPIDAVLSPRYRDPEVFVTRDDGTTQRLDLRAGPNGAFSSTVPCGARKGHQQIEITASDAQGSTVLANFPVWCAAEPPVSVTVDASHDDAPPKTPDEAEVKLLAMLQRDRQAAGLPALVPDARDAAVARAHSEEMRETKIVAHISPRTGSAADRVHAANIKTAVVLENVARAYGVREAHEGLMNSPGHRANIMSGAATHVGIGIAFGEEVSGKREMFVTQVFTRVPPVIEPARASAIVGAKLDGARKTQHAAPLGAIAQQLAALLAAGKQREQAYQVVQPQLDALARSYTRVSSVVTAAADLDTLDGAQLFGDMKPDAVGVGVAQGPHPEIGEGAYWIVVLLAQNRAPR